MRTSIRFVQYHYLPLAAIIFNVVGMYTLRYNWDTLSFPLGVLFSISTIFALLQMGGKIQGLKMQATAWLIMLVSALVFVLLPPREVTQAHEYRIVVVVMMGFLLVQMGAFMNRDFTLLYFTPRMPMRLLIDQRFWKLYAVHQMKVAIWKVLNLDKNAWDVLWKLVKGKVTPDWFLAYAEELQPTESKFRKALRLYLAKNCIALGVMTLMGFSLFIFFKTTAGRLVTADSIYWIVALMFFIIGLSVYKLVGGSANPTMLIFVCGSHAVCLIGAVTTLLMYMQFPPLLKLFYFAGIVFSTFGLFLFSLVVVFQEQLLTFFRERSCKEKNLQKAEEFGVY